MVKQPTTEDHLTLGEIIRRQRELAELSMRQLAAMAGISGPYLSQIERGLRDPSAEVLDALADSLQIPPHCSGSRRPIPNRPSRPSRPFRPIPI